MVLGDAYRKRLYNLIIVAFVVAAIAIGAYFYLTANSGINSIRTSIDLVRDAIGGSVANSIDVNLAGIMTAFIAQTVVFLIAIISLAFGLYYLSGLYFVERRNALIDPLTQLFNRKAVTFALDREFRRSIRFKHPLTVALVDIDYFKVYNDTLGHPAGDRLLKKFSRILRKTIRKVDYVGRIGGEEFMIVLPETNLKEGTKLLDRLRKVIEKTAFYGEAKLPHKNVTMSIGIAEFVVGGRIKRKELIDKADQRLYKAKHAGRNIVVSK